MIRASGVVRPSRNRIAGASAPPSVARPAAPVLGGELEAEFPICQRPASRCQVFRPISPTTGPVLLLDCGPTGPYPYSSPTSQVVSLDIERKGSSSVSRPARRWISASPFRGPVQTRRSLPEYFSAHGSRRSRAVFSAVWAPSVASMVRQSVNRGRALVGARRPGSGASPLPRKHRGASSRGPPAPGCSSTAPVTRRRGSSSARPGPMAASRSQQNPTSPFQPDCSRPRSPPRSPRL